MCEKQDLREYSDNELSLIVFNDEYLYRMRHKEYLFEELDEFFLYTQDQLDTLKQDLEDDANENE